MRGGPSVLLQADGTNDSGSVSRRLGSEGNFVGDADGGEADDSANHNMQHYRLVPRTSSMSPSSESPLRKTPSAQQNMEKTRESKISKSSSFINVFQLKALFRDLDLSTNLKLYENLKLLQQT